LLAPFAPHLCEELWARLGRRPYVVDRVWPQADAGVAREETIELAVQVNGKVRGHLQVGVGASEQEILRLAMEEPRVKEHLTGKEMVKQVVVPGRLVSLVVR